MASEEREKVLSNVKSILRSILISVKEGIPANRLESDYRELASECIPYKKLGFKTIQEFIKSVPDVVRISMDRFGGAHLFPVANSETAHILNMVQNQRSKKVRSKKITSGTFRRPKSYAPSYPSRFTSRPSSNRPSYPAARGRQFKGPPRRPSYNDSNSRPPYNNYNGPSKPLYKTFGGSSGSSYRDFSVTVTGRSPRGNSVELGYNNSPDNDARKTQMASVVVKPPVYKQMRAENYSKEDVKFGQNFEVPPRFKPHGKQDTTPVAPWGMHQRVPILPTPTPMNYNWVPPRPPKHYSTPILELATSVDRGKLYKKILTDHCLRQSCPEPAYDNVPFDGGFVCSVQVDRETFGSRDAYQNAEAAEEAAAMNACEALNIEKGLQSASKRMAAMTTEDLTCDPKVKERILEILKSKGKGIWITRLPVEYQEKYKTEAPSNLQALLQSWTDSVKLESIEHSNKYIVYYQAPEAEVLIADFLPIRERVAIFMTYLSETGDFYVHKGDFDIDTFNEGLQTLSQHASRITGPELKPGLFCVAKYDVDNTWCRGRVLQYTPENNTVDVIFLDYGNIEQVALESIRRLNSKLSSPNAQAVRCVLYGVAPLEGDLWSGDAIECFADLVGNNEHHALTISHQDGTSVIKLFSPLEDSECINTIMVSKGLLKPTVKEYEVLVPVDDNSSQTSDETTTAPPGEPGLLIIPEEHFWNIYVSCFTSICNITFRLVGEQYSDLLEKLEVDLEGCFQKSPTQEDALKEDVVCVAHVDGLFHRVRILDLRRNKTAVCYFLDHGDTDDFELNQLRLITPEYNTLPYQACHCGLAGLDFGSESQMTLALEQLNVLGKTVVAEVVSSNARHHNVILYDTSGEEDVNINDAIAEVIAEEQNKKTPTPSSQMPWRINITEPSDDQLSVTSESSTTSSTGVVTVKPKFLQFQSSRETSVLTDTDSMSSESSTTSERPVTLKPKFLSRSRTENKSPNQTPVSALNLQNVNNSLTESANVIQTNADHTDTIERLINSAIQTLKLEDFQASSGYPSSGFGLDLQLHDPDLEQPNSIEPAMLDRFAQGITEESILGTSLPQGLDNSSSSNDERFSVGPEDIPLPETCSEFSSLSDADFGQPELLLKGFDKSPLTIQKAKNESKTPTRDSVNQTIAGMGAHGDATIENIDIWSDKYLDATLPPYFKVPTIGEYIDVHVRWVSSPTYFVCMPYDSLPQYAALMSDLSKYVEENPKVRSLNQDEIKLGHLYAGFQNDTWYRVVVKQFHDDENLVILLADIGEFETISLNDLQPLPLQFWSLPFQAFKAKLHGVSADSAKGWSEAGKFKFMELVANKDLVGMIRGKDKTAGFTTLDLIDTSDETQDIYINEVFSNQITSWLDS